jgi:hypothetical protein
MTYKICQYCNGPIYRNEVELQKKERNSWKSLGSFHNHCSTKEIKKYELRKTTK